jgi:hypothetical protein
MMRSSISNADTTEDEDEDDVNMSPEASRVALLKRVNSVGAWDAATMKQKAKVEDEMNRYVNGQLERLRVDEDALAMDVDDEIGAHANGGEADYFGSKAKGSSTRKR